LPKFDKQDKVWPWAQFLKSKTKEEFDKLGAAYPEVKMAVAKLKQLSWVKQWRLVKEQEALWKADLRIMKEDAREEGLREGRERAAKRAGKKAAKKVELKNSLKLPAS
jgi:hypothetical protein